MKKTFNVAIVGATGLIGNKFISVLEKNSFPIKTLNLLASQKSEGKIIRAFGKQITVNKLDKNSFSGVDLAFFSAGKEISNEFVPIALKSGAFVIDNSSAFRQSKNIPLVVPEINGEILKTTDSRLISNPNCSTAIAVLPLKMLDSRFGVKRVIFTTYQAISGSGQRGINDFLSSKNGEKPKFYKVDASKNFIPEIGNYSVYGYTDEELKLINETQKILGKRLQISATCVRVPIENCHGVSVEAELEKEFLDEDIKTLFRSVKGTRLCDLPTPQKADGIDDVLIGRIKRSLAFKSGLSYFCVGDNTLKGAALNAVQIAQALVSYGKLQ
ncbi:MAG: aspartate-semialdehyde dehydrogenase [Clostridia bacterium]|nr:aspartate-semialdehyde dehydrogenase [Clostridia bacterium]